MVSSGTVNSNLSSVTSAMQKYASCVSDLQGTWKGPSADSIQAKVSECASSFSSAISSQMSDFAKACDLYKDYERAKSNLQTAKSNYSAAVNNQDNNAISRYNSDINSYESKIKNLKSQIESLLSSAASKKLEATPISGLSTTSIGGDASAQTGTESTAPTTTTTSSGGKDWTKDSNFQYYAQGGGWKNYKYNGGKGSNTMAKSGCGPTSMAMVLRSLGYNVNPNVAADWSSSHNYHPSGGTAEGYFTAYAKSLGVKNKVLGKSANNIKTALQNNELVILHVGPGKNHFTKKGHFMVARGYDPKTNKILIADPARKSNGWYNLNDVVSQLKGSEASWSFST